MVKKSKDAIPSPYLFFGILFREPRIKANKVRIPGLKNNKVYINKNCEKE
jgi:hypothetical protein